MSVSTTALAWSAITALEKFKQTGERQWTACCKAHDDRHSSLSIRLGDDDRILLTCFTGCTSEAIVHALGYELRDLFPQESRTKRQAPRHTRYELRTADGALRGTHVRKDFLDEEGKPDKRVWWEPKGVMAKDMPLWRLGDLLDAPADATVYICEGEKAADALRAAGLLAVGTVTGASNIPCDASLQPLAGHLVTLWPDNDEPGRKHMQRLAERLQALGQPSELIQWIDWPDAPLKGDAADWCAAGHGAGDLAQFIHETLDKTDNERTQDERTQDEASQRPQLQAEGRHLRDVTADLVHALQEANHPPALFQRSSELVRIRVRDDDRPTIESVSRTILRQRVAEVVDFVTWRRNKQTDTVGLTPISPPMDVIDNTLALPSWPFPGIVGIVEAPTLRPDGTILDQPGYDSVTRLVYHPAPGFTPPTVPSHPTAAQLADAVVLIDDVLADFPFDSAASRAHAFALLLTSIVRPAISGPTPLGVITAPTAGTGKGKLANVAGNIATGGDIAVMAAPDNDDEWRKTLLATLRGGPAFILIDNIRGALSSAALEAALTATSYTQRLLGTNDTPTIPQRATWVATGNNLQLAGDMVRRCYRIKLDAKTAHPEQRSAFRHPDLERYVRQHRSELVGALLTMARAWFADGCPAYDVPVIGSYDEWAHLVGSILEHADIAGFLSNREEMFEEADPDRPQWVAFLSAWHATYGEKALTAKEVANDLKESTTDELKTLRSALPEALADEVKLSTALSYALRAQTDRRYEAPDGRDVWVARGGKDRTNLVRWRVLKAPAPTSPTGDAEDRAEDAKHHPMQSSTPTNSGLAQGVHRIAEDDSLPTRAGARAHAHVYAHAGAHMCGAEHPMQSYAPVASGQTASAFEAAEDAKHHPMQRSAGAALLLERCPATGGAHETARLRTADGWLKCIHCDAVTTQRARL